MLVAFQNFGTLGDLVLAIDCRALLRHVFDGEFGARKEGGLSTVSAIEEDILCNLLPHRRLSRARLRSVDAFLTPSCPRL